MIPFIFLDELKDDFNAFLKNNALWIALVLIGVIVIAVILILIFNKKNYKNKKPEAEIAEKSAWVIALGGEENIISSEAVSSRLVVILKDKQLLDKEALKQLGVTNFMEMSNKITLLLEDKAELVKKELDK